MKIIKILHFQKRTNADGSEYALVNVLLEDGGDAICIVGGDVDLFLHKGQIRAHIKRNKRLDTLK